MRSMFECEIKRTNTSETESGDETEPLSAFNQDISSWTVSNVTDMSSMGPRCSGF